MKLYYADVLNPRKACALAKHIAAPVEFVRVALEKGEHLRPSFRAKNPNGKVPVLEDGDATIWEADAIMVHLAFHAGSDLWPRDARQIEVIRWFGWNQAHLNRCGGTLYFENVVKPKFGSGTPDAALVAEAREAFSRHARVLDAHLSDRTWLLGDALSLADFAVGAPFPWAAQAGLPLDERPAIRAWADRLAALPAWADPYPAHG